MPGTRQYRVADTWRLFPTHCATPTISDTELTIIQATDTLTALGGTVPSSTSESIAQAQAIQQLRSIRLSTLQHNAPPPPTTGTPSPRVLLPRLLAMPETKVPTTSPSWGCCAPSHVIIRHRPYKSNSDSHHCKWSHSANQCTTGMTHPSKTHTK